MKFSNNLSSSTQEKTKATGTTSLSGWIQGAFCAAMLAGSPAALSATSVSGIRDSDHTTSGHVGKSLKKAVSQKTSVTIWTDFNKTYPGLYNLLYGNVSKNPTFDDVGKSIFKEAYDQIDLLNHFQGILNLEILYRKEKIGIHEFDDLYSGMNQIQQEVQSLEKISEILQKRELEYVTLGTISTEEKRNLDKKYLWLLEKAIEDNSQIRLSEKETKEWLTRITKARKKLGYTYDVFDIWMLQYQEDLAAKKREITRM